MRRLLLLPLLATCLAFNPVHAQPNGPPPGAYPPGPPPGAYPPGPPPRPHGPYGRPAYNTENCGTPDEPKPCPPMPRVPLQYYPANRQ